MKTARKHKRFIEDLPDDIWAELFPLIYKLYATQFSSIGQAVSEIFIFVLYFILFYFGGGL